MPRARKRNGQGSANRTDLRPAKVAVGPSEEYGQGARLEAAQRAVPMAAAAPPPPPGAGGEAGAQGPMPGSFGAFNRGTERPSEPMTAGMPMGAGPGPEALLMNQNQPDPDLALLRPILPTLELLASQPNASSAARNYVRRVRGAMPRQQ